MLRGASMKHQLGISCPRATGFPWSFRPFRICLLIFASAAASAAGPVDVSKLPPPANRPVDFAREIRPIFQNSCTSCHGAEKQKSSYRLDARAGALKGGETYHPAIQPGRSAESPLIHLVPGLVPETKMPAKGDPLTAEQIGLLRAWIDQGASWPEDGPAEVDPLRSHWAFRPVTPPAVPARQPPPAAAGPANQ